MRPIKFRAWDKKLNKMFLVDTLDVMDGKATFSHHALPEESLSGNGCRHLQDYDLMQFTGLHDKNGKEIWEGDVVKIESKYPTEDPITCTANVFFKDGAFTTDFHDALIRIALPGNWLVEVIGNIYEATK